MKRWMHKVEVIVDKAIPPCLILLLIIIVMDLGFPDLVEHYHLHYYILTADYIIIAIFVADLFFKWLRTMHAPLFLKKYWLDILAVFPFFLLFRVFELAAGAFSAAISEGAHTVQAVVHEGLEIEKEGAKLLREAEKFAKEGSRIVREAEKMSKLSRSARFMRFLRPILRIPRFFKAVPKIMGFYEKPTGEHHTHEFMHKHSKKK
ncbi:hypothetical protein JW898_00870 [Candidatus Woesearchaeota archaeon]|nr:hypothetical protein [Candidatus Woesearchaeota archaeon]